MEHIVAHLHDIGIIVAFTEIRMKRNDEPVSRSNVGQTVEAGKCSGSMQKDDILAFTLYEIGDGFASDFDRAFSKLLE